MTMSQKSKVKKPALSESRMGQKSFIKNIILIFFVITSFFWMTSFVLADQNLSDSAMEQLEAGGKKANYNVENTSDPREFLNIIIRAILGLTASISVGLTVYAGFLYVTSRGEESKVDQAKKMLTGAIIGLAILFSAYSISWFVSRSVLQVTDYGGENINFIE
jgi:magnesium-transporting ATPase (P-type)